MGRTGMRSALSLMIAAALLVGCGGGAEDDDPTPSASATASPIERPSSVADLTIVSPANGDVIEGSSVNLRVELDGATIVPETTTELAPDEGHLHVLLDDELISMTEGLEQTIPDVEPGPHRIQVEFVASDHAPFDPRVVQVVAFEVAS